MGQTWEAVSRAQGKATVLGKKGPGWPDSVQGRHQAVGATKVGAGAVVRGSPEDPTLTSSPDMTTEPMAALSYRTES